MLFLKSLLRDAPKRHRGALDWPRPSSLTDDENWTHVYEDVIPCEQGWHFFAFSDDAFTRWANWGEELWLIEIPEDALIRLNGDKIVASCARLIRPLAIRDSILSPKFKSDDMAVTDEEHGRLVDGFEWWAALYQNSRRHPERSEAYVVSDTMLVSA